MKTMIRGTKGVAMAVALSTAAALGACAKKADTGADTTAMATAGDTSMKAGTMNNMNNAGATTGAMATGAGSSMNNGMMAGSQTWTDADIFAMVGAVNRGEIAEGSMASTKATNPTVRAFAKDMVTAHTALLNNGQALAKRLNITPSASADTSIVAMNKSMASMVGSTPKGMAFDTAYVNSQVEGHTMALNLIKTAEGRAQNAQLKTMLTTAEPIIQKHLDRAKDIQGQMK
ncbi:MAG: DUF4142 domain-containing protein [Gemmatimonadaceae bacterium]